MSSQPERALMTPSPGPTPIRFRKRLMLLCLVLFCACGAEPETPEAQVRRTLDALEAAAEAGDVSAFKDGVSESYQDAMGHDKKALGAYVSMHVLRNKSRHVVLRVRDVLVISPGRAEVVVIAGIAGSAPAAGAAFRGNVYRIDANVEEESAGEWRLTWAQWKPTAPAELL